MGVKDKYHDEFRAALEKEGWEITDDPLRAELGNIRLFIDLGAERLIAAEKENERIAIEIKTFGKASFMTNLYEAIGKYICYRYIIKVNQMGRKLYLAMPINVHEKFEQEPIMKVLEEENIHLILYEAESKTIHQWIK